MSTLFIACAALLAVGVLLVVGRLEQQGLARRRCWESGWWIEYRYPAIKKDPSLKVGVQRGLGKDQDQLPLRTFSVGDRDDAKFWEALAEAEEYAMTLNIAARTERSSR